jgi:Lrp/AsnC family leucine-responsive transcriptional regulator
MINIDIKDRRILYQLDLDSRQSFRSIGKKVGLSKDSVVSRVQKLQQNGIIKGFYTVIDYSKLGYSSYRIYLVFQNTNPDIENEIIKYFVDNDIVFWVCKAEGAIDLEVVVWVRDLKDFDVFWENTLIKYRKYFQNQIFSAYLLFCHYKSTYLLENEKIDCSKCDITGLGKNVPIDEVDYQILKFLASDSRINTSEIAKKLDLNAVTVKNRIKKLSKSEIIVGYRLNIDFLKLGYEFYKVDITLIEYRKRNQIIEYMKNNPNVFMLTKTAGYDDLEFDFIVKDVTQLSHIMEELKIKFPNTIKNYKYFFQPEIHKIVYIPIK